MGIANFFISQIQTNPFAGAALVAMPAAAMSYSIRNLPIWLGKKIKNISFNSFTVNNDKFVYDDILSYLTQHVIIERFSRTHSVKSKDNNDYWVPTSEYSMTKGENKIISRKIEIGYGRHFGLYRGHLVVVHKSLIQSGNSDAFKETCTCSFLGGSKKLIDTFMGDLENYINSLKKEASGISLYINAGGYWILRGKVAPRAMESIFLPDSTTQRIIDNVDSFASRRNWNNAKCLPNRTGILLHGNPGTGKSSLIQALATHFKRDIYYLDLSTIKSSSVLNTLMSKEVDWKQVFLVVEDVDATGAKIKNRKEDGDDNKIGLTLSALLNAFDGLISPEDMVILATTNHKDHIDPALLRPGRFDLQIEIGYCGRKEFEDMVEFFELDISDYTLDYFEPMSGAQIRSMLIEKGVVAVMDYQRSIHTQSPTLSLVKDTV